MRHGRDVILSNLGGNRLAAPLFVSIHVETPFAITAYSTVFFAHGSFGAFLYLVNKHVKMILARAIGLKHATDCSSVA